MLGTTDRKILAELDFNSRQSFSEIARKIKTSKEVVRYHFENLLKRGVIKNSYALIDTYKLGYLIHIVWIKFNNITHDIENEMIEKLVRSKNVGVAIKLYGKWDFVIGVWAKNTIEFNNYYDAATKSFQIYIKEQLVTVEINCSYLSQEFLYNARIARVRIGDKLYFESVDSEDLNILKELAMNSRISSIDLAGKFNVSANTIIGRIKKLEKKGIIAAYKINVDYEKLGFSHHRIFLKVRYDSKEKVRNYLESIPIVISVTNYVGYANIDFRICVKNPEEIRNLLTDLRVKFQDSILEYDSVMFLKSFEVLNFLPL